MTTGDWFSAWLALRAGTLAPRSVDCYADEIRLHIAPALGAVPLDELQPGQIMAMLAAICTAGHTRTALLCYAIMRKSLFDAQASGLVRVSPMVGVPRPHHASAPPRWLTPAEIPPYVQAISEDPHRLAWLLALCCGLRRGELCGLRWQDIDFHAQVMTICNQRQRLASGAIIDKPPKSAAGRRSLPIPADVLPALRAGRQFAGYVVLARTGRPITPSGLDQAHARLLARAGLPHIRLHDIRHTMGAVAIRQQVPIKVLQYLLGHASYTTTADIYAHVDADAARTALDCITQAVL